MAEPATTSTGLGSLAAFVLAVAGPAAGDYAVILFAALAGSTWPLSQREDITRKQGFWLVMRLVLTSFALTSFVTYLLTKASGWPVAVLLSPVAFGIAAMGNNWRRIIEVLSKRLATIVGGQQP